MKFNQDSKLHVEHLVSTIKEVLNSEIHGTISGKDAYLYFNDKSYFTSTEQGTAFISLALGDGFDYYITYWKCSNRSIITLTHDDFPFEDDYDAGRMIHVKHFSTEEEHFQTSLMNARVNYPFEVIPLLESLIQKLNGVYDEVTKCIR